MHQDRFSSELWRSAKSWDVWGTLSWADIRLRYRRTTLGPLWVTLSLGTMIMGVGVLYAGLFASNPSRYIPYLASGSIAWTFLSSTLIEGCSLFIAGAGLVKSTSMPLPNYVFRLVSRNLIIFFHNAIIIFALWIIFRFPSFAAILLAFIGLIIAALAVFGSVLTLSAVCARYRDMPQIVGAILQFAFFLTPIVWLPEGQKAAHLVLTFNPFYYLVEIVRRPLLGDIPDARIWLTALCLALLSFTMGFLVFGRFRHRIAYWL